MICVLNESELATLQGAIGIAHAKYVENAAILRQERPQGYEFLAQQFDRQAADALKVAERLDGE